MQVYYGKVFFPVAIGMEEKAHFYKRHIPFYDDFVKLDRLLPKDVTLLVPDFLLDPVYAPRSVFFDLADVPEGKDTVLFTSPDGAVSLSPLGYRQGQVLYKNAQAVLVTYRTPGRSPERGPILALQLIRSQ
jgi:hypothetical protein